MWTGGRPGTGRPWGTVPRRSTPCAASPNTADAAMPAATTRSATGLIRKESPSDEKQAEGGDTEDERGGVRLGEVRDEVLHPLPEFAVGALEPEQLRELRAGQMQGHPGLEAGHDRLGDEAHEASRARGPGREGQRGHDESGGRGECGVARRVATRKVPERRAYEERDRGDRGDSGVLRAAEEPEHETGEQAGVQACLGGQTRQGGGADPVGDQVRGEDGARDHVPAQPAALVSAQETQAGQFVGDHTTG